MRERRVSPLLLILLSALLLGSLSAVEDPAARFLQAYQAFSAGERFEGDSRLDDALAKYRFCVSVLEQLQKEEPDYQAVVIDFRLGKSREAVGRVESLLQSSPDLPAAVEGVADSELEGPLPVRDDLASDLSLPPAPARAPEISQPAVRPEPRPRPAAPLVNSLGTYRIPVPGGETSTQRERPRPASPTIEQSPVAPSVGRGAALAFQEEINALRSELKKQTERVRQLDEELLGSLAREQNALRELDRTKVLVVEQKSQMAQLRQTLEDTKAVNRSLTEEQNASAQEVAAVEAELEAARADLEVVEEYNGELFAKLERAAGYITASDEIRKNLEGERLALHEKLTTGRDQETAQLAAQNQELTEKLELARTDAATAEKLTEENRELADKLAAAESKITQLAALDPEREAIADGLRADLATVNEKLASVTASLSEGRVRIADLEKQLDETSRATASTMGAMAEENALLRTIVERQLADESKRQQARKLVEEEMQKLGVRSEQLLAGIENLTGDSVALSAAEQEVLDAPKRTFESGSTSGSNFAIVLEENPSEESGPNSDLPPDLLAQAEEANRLFREEKFPEALAIYESLAAKAPTNQLITVNLGISQLRLGQYDAAIATLAKALENDTENAVIQTHLGIANYRSGRLDSAQQLLEAAAAAEPTNYQAHYFLGLILNRDDGDRGRAITELQRAIDLKPDYAQAHLNLALIYATAQPPSKDPARQHYRKAIDFGASPDASLEELIR